jgi:holo-[acyl-carrier protein] synthase
LKKNFSVGVDIEEVNRFKRLIRNKRFLARVFTPQEIKYCSGKKNKAQHFAVRFAAKEAVWKAASHEFKGKGRAIGHRDIGVKNAMDGKPEVMLPTRLARLAKKIFISLSHTDNYALATAVLNG